LLAVVTGHRIACHARTWDKASNNVAQTPWQEADTRKADEEMALNQSPATSRKFTVLLFEEPEGGYSVEVPELPGCFTEGDTLDEAARMYRALLGDDAHAPSHAAAVAHAGRNGDAVALDRLRRPRSVAGLAGRPRVPTWSPQAPRAAPPARYGSSGPASESKSSAVAPSSQRRSRSACCSISVEPAAALPEAGSANAP